MIIMTMMTTISVYGYKKAFAILLIIMSVSILTIIGFTNAVYNTSTTTNPNLQYQSNNKNDNNQCNRSHALHVKMFDSETVPKYIIGKDYKVTPVSPSTTDVIMNGCSLAAEGISQ
jgi:hypothetical protein